MAEYSIVFQIELRKVRLLHIHAVTILQYYLI